jgi:hypothetical protein
MRWLLVTINAFVSTMIPLDADTLLSEDRGTSLLAESLALQPAR